MVYTVNKPYFELSINRTPHNISRNSKIFWKIRQEEYHIRHGPRLMVGFVHVNVHLFHHSWTFDIFSLIYWIFDYFDICSWRDEKPYYNMWVIGNGNATWIFIQLNRIPSETIRWFSRTASPIMGPIAHSVWFIAHESSLEIIFQILDSGFSYQPVFIPKNFKPWPWVMVYEPCWD